MKYIILILAFSTLGLSGCASKSIDMSTFVIDEFSQVDKACDKDAQCKTLKVGYRDCANFRYMVYSSKFIFGSNEAILENLTKEYTSKEFEAFGEDNCVLMSAAPYKGTCYKQGCEMVQTWR